jgi:hypothetical protein
MFDENHPNYLLVKFLSRDVMEQALAEYTNKSSAKYEESLKEQYTDIRDQVCVLSCIHLLFCSNILQLSLFDNNPYAAGEEREYAVAKKGCFDDFHVGIVTTNKKRFRKSDKLRALLSYISRHVQVLSCSFCLTIYFIVYNIFVLWFYCADSLCQCAWIHTVFNGNFSNDLSDAVVYLCRFFMPLLSCCD